MSEKNPPKIKVFVSYSWETQRETKVVDELERLCADCNIQLIRDNTSLIHGASIEKFMNNLGSADHVITIFSKPYFESKWCMYELLRIYQHGAKTWPLNVIYDRLGINQFRQFARRTHPVIADDCDLQNDDYRLSVVDYWHDKTVALENKLKSRATRSIGDEKKRLQLYKKITSHINKLQNFTADRVTTSLSDLQNRQFAQLLDRINPGNKASTDLKSALIDRQTQWKHIDDRIKTRNNSDKAIAFIVTGVAEEWPEAMQIRLKKEFDIPHKKDSEIKPKFSGKFKESIEKGLWYSILDKTITDKSKLNAINLSEYETVLIDELSSFEEPKYFFWLLDKQSYPNLDYRKIQNLAKRWQGLELMQSKHPHFLIFIYRFEPKSLRKYWRNPSNDWFNRIARELNETDKPEILVPKLSSPTVGEITDWLDKYHDDLMQDDKDRILKALKKKLRWGKAPHLKLKEAYRNALEQ